MLLVVEPNSTAAKGMLWAGPEVIAHRFRLVEVDESVLLVEFEAPDGMGQLGWIYAHGRFIDEGGGDIYYMMKAYLWGLHKGFTRSGIGGEDRKELRVNTELAEIRAVLASAGFEDVTSDVHTLVQRMIDTQELLRQQVGESYTALRRALPDCPENFSLQALARQAEERLKCKLQ